MPRTTYGPTFKARAKRLLEALLAFVNYEVEGCEQLELHFRWQGEDSANPQLLVETKLRVLEYLTAKDKHPGKLTKAQIRQALNQHLKEFLGILKDTRAKTQGEEDWHFTLTLWGKDKETNLRQFELEWERKRPDKSKKLEATFVETQQPASPPSPPDNRIDWHQVCRAMLDKQREEYKFRRQITGRELGHEVGVYVPLGLTQRKAAPQRDEKFSPSASEGMQQYQLTETESKKYEHQQFLDDVIGKAGKNIAIAGEPGAGKTTWLEQIALYLDKAEKAIAYPIAIPLASVGEKTLEEFLLQNWLKDALPFIKKAGKVTPALEEEFIELFNSGKVWLLLDGADEMRVSAPLLHIDKQLTGWVNRARVVLTCRLNVWEANPNALPNFQTYRTLNFEDEQVREFIGQWFAKSDKPELGKALQEKLAEAGKERIRDVVKNPLRVAMLCKLWYFHQGDLPETRAGLYEQFSRDFYQWKHHELLTGNWEKQQELHAALGKVAVEAIEKKCPLRDRFVRKVMGQPLFQLACEVGWLNQVYHDAKTGSPVYAFFHLTFQEYFAALAVDDWHFFLNHIPDNPMQGVYRIFEPKWKEPILLWLGREDVPPEQKEQFIQGLIEFADGWSMDFYGYRAYFLAAAGVAEFKDCQRADEIVAEIVKWGFGYFNIEKQEWQRFLYPIAEGAMAALLETNRKKAIQALVELIRSSQDESTRRQATESLGKISAGNDTAIQALVELIRSSQDESTRRQAAESLGKIGAGNPTAIQALVELIRSSQDEDTRRQAAESLGKIGAGNPTAIQALVELIRSSQDEDTRRGAAERLGEIGAGNPTAIQALVELIRSSQSEFTRRGAAESLGKIDAGNPTAIQALVELIRSYKTEFTRRQAADSLGEIDAGNPTAIQALVELIRSSQDEDTRRQAAESLGEIDAGNPTAIQALVELIRSSQDEDTRRQAAESLGEIDAGNPMAIQALVELIGSSQDKNTRLLAAESLEKIGAGNPPAIQALLELIRSSQDEFTRWLAAYSLGVIDAGNQTAIQALVELIRSSQDESTRWLAAYSLGVIDAGNQIAIQALVELIRSSQDEDTRRQAADNLGEIGAGNPTAIQALVELIRSSQDEDTRRQAADNLGKIGAGNPTVIQALVELIRSFQDEFNRRRAAYSLGKIGAGNPTAIQALVELIRSSEDEDTRWGAASSLKNILRKQEQMAGVVTALKDYLSDETYENDFDRFDASLEVIWHCAPTLPYPIFYQAWHHPQLTAHPEVAETAGVGFTADSIRRNLTELPLLLGAALAEAGFTASLQLICIDGSKFIERDNPAAKIYNEMCRHKCPESSDGTPKKMADLQAYWDELTRKSDKPIVLVFYENPTPPAPQGFSPVFLDALSKFDGAICAVTDEPLDGLPLQQFDAGEPHLVENMVKWMRGILLEGL